MKESQHQKLLFQWAKWAIPEYESYLFHIPNGGSRHRLEAYNLKLQGVKPGIPDIFLAVPKLGFHGLFIELKSEKGRLSEQQANMLYLLNKRGYFSQVCMGWEDASYIIKNYLGC